MESKKPKTLRDIVSHPQTLYVDDEESPLPVGRLFNVYIEDGDYMH